MKTWANKCSFSERVRQLFGIGAPTQHSDTVWLALLEGMKDDIEGTREFKQVVRNFLIPDMICPFKFKVNWIVLSRRGLHPLFQDNEITNSTPSVQRFSLVTNRPKGYPEWFLAAYPDVASWFTMQVDAVAIGAADSDAESVLHNVFGDITENELVDSDRRIKSECLRTLIDHYRKETSRALECNIGIRSNTLSPR